MANFKFRLDILLRLAANKEEEIKKELASWQKLKIDAEKKMEEFDKVIVQTTIEKSEKKTIDEILVFEAYIERLRISKTKTSDEIEFFNKKIEISINKLQEAMRERKILEKLKEKKFEQYQKEQDLIEQKELDEIGIKLFIDGR